jgi:hypothetical protein
MTMPLRANIHAASRASIFARQLFIRINQSRIHPKNSIFSASLAAKYLHHLNLAKPIIGCVLSAPLQLLQIQLLG